MFLLTISALLRVCSLSFSSTLRKFRFLKFLKLQLSLASYRSRSLRFRITLFHKSKFSLLEICSQLGQSQIMLCFNLLLPSLIRVRFTSPYANFAKKRDIFSVPNNSECKRKMFYYPSCFKVSKVSVLGMYMCDFKIGFKEKV